MASNEQAKNSAQMGFFGNKQHKAEVPANQKQETSEGAFVAHFVNQANSGRDLAAIYAATKRYDISEPYEQHVSDKASEMGLDISRPQRPGSR